MELNAQRRIAAKIMKCGESRVWMDPARLGDIAQAITTQDIRKLVSDDVIKKRPELGVSSARTKHTAVQKSKGRRKGSGSRKGAIGTRYSKKKRWISAIRAQRALAKELLKTGKIEKKIYKNIYRKSGGGYFRSRAHLAEYAGVKDFQAKETKKPRR